MIEDDDVHLALMSHNENEWHAQQTNKHSLLIYTLINRLHLQLSSNSNHCFFSPCSRTHFYNPNRKILPSWHNVYLLFLCSNFLGTTISMFVVCLLSFFFCTMSFFVSSCLSDIFHVVTCDQITRYVRWRAIKGNIGYFIRRRNKKGKF